MTADDLTPPRIVAFPESEAPEHLRLQALDLQEQAWPSAPAPAPAATPPTSPAPPAAPAPAPAYDPRHDPALRPLSLFLLAEDGRTVLASLDVLSKQLDHAGRRYAASGLSRVVSSPAHRGRGHGRRLVAAALDTVRRGGADLGLFTCDRPLRGFYEGAGWQFLPGAVLVGGTAEEPFPSDRPGFDKVTMAAFLTPHARVHAADFRHTRIALHPGPVDRLW
ncbi:GNAT family N-acetyltransferase [Streptacidiphilus cavernicola]|uniref:GNAT family N-acetyltransferase n=1 Tax=Streptacidiphilus cavernicola TaxID=3342716 RepID=A0ABV6VR06_9ACTN